ARRKADRLRSRQGAAGAGAHLRIGRLVPRGRSRRTRQPEGGGVRQADPGGRDERGSAVEGLCRDRGPQSGGGRSGEGDGGGGGVNFRLPTLACCTTLLALCVSG